MEISKLNEVMGMTYNKKSKFGVFDYIILRTCQVNFGEHHRAIGGYIEKTGQVILSVDICQGIGYGDLTAVWKDKELDEFIKSGKFEELIDVDWESLSQQAQADKLLSFLPSENNIEEYTETWGELEK